MNVVEIAREARSTGISVAKRALRSFARIAVALNIHRLFPFLKISAFPEPVRRRLAYLQNPAAFEETDIHTDVHFHRLQALRKG